MTSNDRSVSEVLQAIVRNIQDIIRSEVKLAKTEIREEVVKAKAATTLATISVAAGLFAVLFLLWTAVYGLAIVMPLWVATAVVGVVLAIISGVTLRACVQHFKRVHPVPERTVETIKENVEWVKQQAK